MDKEVYFFNKIRLPASLDKKQLIFSLAWTFAFLLALYLRTSGLFRGLGDYGNIFHPDEPKQVQALFNFLRGNYVTYYGSLFYDGYPFGLNHLDEYLIRLPLLFLGTEIRDPYFIYYWALSLRAAYSMIILIITYHLVKRLVQDSYAALLAMFLLAIAPLAITVSHFATGDIGVDLFMTICFLFLLFYTDNKHKYIWLFAAGIAVGGAFSAKYNGLLVGMVPGMVLCFEFLTNRRIGLFLIRCVVLVSGTLAGVVLFTPALLMDFDPTLTNMMANFAFIKNYNVPPDILAKSWLARAFLGLKNNSLYIIASLGYLVCLFSIPGLIAAWKQYRLCLFSPEDHHCSRKTLILSIATFPILSLFISLTGKYVVQPFHFSYLQLPLIIVTCFLFSVLQSSHNLLLRAASLLLIASVIFEFAPKSRLEDFFWRREDNRFYEQQLPASIFTAEAITSQHGGKIRSLFLEPPGDSIFRNLRHQAHGPDFDLWNTIQSAPVPQIPNPVGQDWIFLNGPSFPRNERMLFIQGGGRGTTLKRYIVLPADIEPPAFGVRSGSYGTETKIEFGRATAVIKLEAHQQKTVLLKPKKWKVSGGQTAKDLKVHIIPLEVSVPHDDIWLTILTTKKEKEYFTLFGGGQEKAPSVPQKLPDQLSGQYSNALDRLRYMEEPLSNTVWPGERKPIWNVVLPAGRYKLTAEIEGLEDESTITFELEGAGSKGDRFRDQTQSFLIKKGLQTIDYTFSKPFVPYQGRIVVSGVTGNCTLLSFKLVPDYQKIADDFDKWRTKGIKPQWVSRYSENGVIKE